MIHVKMTRHKAVAASIGALTTVLGVVGAAVQDGTVTGDEIAAMVSALITAWGTAWVVWRVPNRPAEPPVTAPASSAGVRR